MGTDKRRRQLLVLPLVAVIASCGQIPYAQNAYNNSPFSGDSVAAYAVNAQRPLAELPFGAGRVISVNENPDGLDLVQRIVLQGEPGTIGTNYIDVRLVRSATERPAMTDAELLKELRAANPERRMSISSYMPANSYGPFGVASDGIGCSYIWQNINSNSRNNFSFFRKPALRAVNVRVRLCQGGPNEKLAISYMQQLRLFVGGVPQSETATIAGVDDLLMQEPEPVRPAPQKTRPVTPTVAYQPPVVRQTPVAQLEQKPSYLLPVPPADIPNVPTRQFPSAITQEVLLTPVTPEVPVMQPVVPTTTAAPRVIFPPVATEPVPTSGDVVTTAAIPIPLP